MAVARVSALVLVAILATPLSPAAQQTSAELYGEFRYSYNYADDGTAWRWGVANNASRLGVRGDIAEGGVVAFFDLQTGVAIDSDGSGLSFSNRYHLAGLRGAFGSLAIGRISPAYKAVGVRLDPFYDTSTLSTIGRVPETGLFAGASFGLSPLNNGFADRTIAYTSPAVAGLVANAALHVDADSDHDWGAGIIYRRQGIEAGAQYFDVGAGTAWAPTEPVDRAARVHLSYSRPDAFSIGFSYERLTDGSGMDQSFIYAAGGLNLARGTAVRAAVGVVEDGGELQSVTGRAVHLGVFQTIVPQVQVHGLYSYLDPDAGEALSNVAVGLTYQFTLRP